MFQALWKLLWTVSNHTLQQSLTILSKTTTTINNANTSIPCQGQGQSDEATILRVDVQIGWRNSRAKPCTHTSTVTPRPSTTQPLGVVATDSFLITWRILPSMGENTFLPCGSVPKWLSSNLLFPDSLYHVGGVWFIGRLVARCNNNDRVDVIETIKPRTDHSSSNMVLDLKSPPLTSGYWKINPWLRTPGTPASLRPRVSLVVPL